MQKLKIGIIDDNHKIAQQLKSRLALVDEVDVLFYADRGHKGIDWLKNNSMKPDLILMDIEMPEMDGIETTFRIRQLYPEIRVMMLTVFDNEEHIFNAIKAGATGYLMKDEKLERMLKAFEEVMEGGAPMSPMVAQKAMQMLLSGYKPTTQQIQYSSGQEELTKREQEILTLLAEGLKNQDIADKLFISAATVKKHVENIYNKLQLHSRVELVNWYKGG